MTVLELEDIQGFVVSSYGDLPCAAYELLRITDPPAARAWLGELLPEITSASGPQAAATNIAFGFGGLARLGLQVPDLAIFPLAFQDGMMSPRRSRILGDTAGSAPEHWEWGGQHRQVDVLVLVFAADEDGLAALLERRAASRGRSGGFEEVCPPLLAARQQDPREHFGFHDSIAQPAVEGFPGRSQERRSAYEKPLKPGEFVLGYPDEYGEPAYCPTVDPSAYGQAGRQLPEAPARARGDLGRNGTYLVFRQLEQHVARFWQFFDRATAPASGGRDVAACERLAAKLVGRWPSGMPLVKAPDRDPTPAGSLSSDNEFTYLPTDPDGLRCPIGAHIRRANPRDSLESGPARSLRTARRHAILRRGRLYGQRIADPFEHDDQSRGLYFICLNGDLERQFEFIQQTWLASPVFGGINGERDPLVANAGGQGVMTIPAEPVRRRLPDLDSFVTVRGGAYFFMPGLRALRYLADLGG